MTSLSLKHIFSHFLIISMFQYALVSWADESKARFPTLVYGIENEIKDFNISRSLDKNAFALAELVTEGLYWQKPNGDLIPDLAIKSEFLGKTWKIYLRKALFSNGKELLCEDVRANLEEARNSKRPIKNRLKDIESSHCESGVLVLKTYRASGQLMKKIASIIRVYDLSTLKDRNPVGSGPYFISGEKGKDIILSRNTHYVGTPGPYDEIRYRALRDPWLRDLALMSGNVDFLLENFSRNRVLAFKKNEDKLKYFQIPTPMLFYLGINKNKITDLSFRKKILSILASSKSVESYWGEQVVRAHQIFETSASWPLEKLDNSLKKREKLEITCIADESQLQFLKQIAQEFKGFGVDISLKPLEFATFMNALNKKNYDSYLFYIDASHIQNLESLLTSTGSRLSLQNPQIDALFTKVQEEEPLADLTEYKQGLEQLIQSEAVMIPLYWAKKHFVMSKSSKVSEFFKMTDRGFWKDLLGPI